MANTYLTYTQQTPSTAEGQKFTWSAWVKKSKNGVIHGFTVRFIKTVTHVYSNI